MGNKPVLMISVTRMMAQPIVVAGPVIGNVIQRHKQWLSNNAEESPIDQGA